MEFRFFIIIALIFQSFVNEKIGIKNDSKEITEIIKTVLEEDSLSFHLITVYPILPKYISRKKSDSFIPGAPPNSDYLFPDIISELKQNVSDYEISDLDREIFKIQENFSEKIILVETDFQNYKLAKKGEDWTGLLVYFSIPILNFEKDLAYIQYGILCSGECGMGGEIFLSKKKNNWTIIRKNIHWVG